MTDDPDHEQDEAPRTDDGLGLARDVTRATAGSTPASRKRRRDDRIPDRRTGPQANRKLGGFSGSHPDERDPKPLEGELSRLVGERGWAVPLRMRGVFARWPELVGPEVADHCTPESFTDGTLVVRTDSTAWATQLKLLAPRSCAGSTRTSGTARSPSSRWSAPTCRTGRRAPARPATVAARATPTADPVRTRRSRSAGSSDV